MHIYQTVQGMINASAAGDVWIIRYALDRHHIYIIASVTTKLADLHSAAGLMYFPNLTYPIIKESGVMRQRSSYCLYGNFPMISHNASMLTHDWWICRTITSVTTGRSGSAQCCSIL